jgi:hypothetical protein
MGGSYLNRRLRARFSLHVVTVTLYDRATMVAGHGVDMVDLFLGLFWP